MKKLSERKKRAIERTLSNNRSYKVYLYNRFFSYLLMVLLQIVCGAFMIWFLAYDSVAAVVVQTLVSVLSVLFVLYISNKAAPSSSRITWILLILVFPVFGVPMYLFYGEGRPTKRINQKIQAAKAENKVRIQTVLPRTERRISDERTDSVCEYLEKKADYPLYTDGTVTYYKSGEEMFPAMLEALKTAEKYILVEYFIIDSGKMWNSICKLLVEKAMQGVQVRIIYDDFGCMMTLPPKYDRYLESLHENIKCMTFNEVVPLFAVRMNNRDHRKLLVIDGKVGFTGGVNLADEYIAELPRFGYWKDSGLRVTGSAVNSFIEMFFYMWNAFRADKEDLTEYLLLSEEQPLPSETALRIQPYDDSPLDKMNVGESVYADMIARAKRSVYIFTPYLVLDDYLRDGLCHAALRGVDVRIVTPGIPDKKLIYRATRANYETLLKAGVRIYEYTPGFIHAKSMLCDGESAVVGTINLDYRSLYLHFENAVYFSGCDAVQDLQRDCEETFALSKECTPAYPKRGLIGRLVDSVLHLIETLL